MEDVKLIMLLIDFGHQSPSCYIATKTKGLLRRRLQAVHAVIDHIKTIRLAASCWIRQWPRLNTVAVAHQRWCSGSGHCLTEMV
jgi:hypothetical protein